MKKILIFSWTGILLIILFFSIRSLLQQGNPDLPSSAYSSVFTPSAFDSLSSPGRYILLTVGSEGCSACELVRNNPVLEDFPLTPYFIEREFCPNNMLVSQALATCGFPMSYVFNDRMEIIGRIHGAASLEERIAAILIKKEEVQPDSLLMLTHAFKSLVAYLNNDRESMFQCALESIGHRSYFFNNYLLYMYYRDKQASDSSEYYKTQALNGLQGSDVFVYETLVRELAPTHPMLEWIPEATHMHDENCNHEHS